MKASPARAYSVAADSGAAAIVGALAQAGTRLVFGVPGGGPNLDVVGAADAAGLRFILAHGETAAVIMAATCADLAGPPGAVVVTRGPGLASAVNGIAHAALDRLPVVVIADTVAAADASRVSHQRIDQAALGRSVAKAAITVGRRHPGEAAARLAAASVASPGRLAPQQVVATVRAGTPPETIAAVDAGAHMLVAMPLWEVPEPRRLLVSSGLATMGYALPAAIAAALCAPQVPVVAFTGDGGLGMTLAEIETAVRLSLRIIVIVFNDAGLSLIKLKQKPAGQGGDDAVRYRPVSFAAAATAMGAAGAAVGTERDLATALAAALRRPGPTVIDASVDPAGYPAVMDLSRGQAGRRSVPGISRALGVPCP